MAGDLDERKDERNDMGQREAVIYTRFSPRPNSEQCESSQRQLERCKAYCVATDMKVIAHYDDRALSGIKAANRPGLAQALRVACERKAALVVYEASRLARNAREALEMLDGLHRRGADLVMISERIDTTQPIGRTLFTVVQALYELERATISKRTRDTMREMQAEGKVVGSKPPYGYMFDEDGPKNQQSGRPSRLKENPKEMPTVRLILHLRNVKNWSPSYIVLHLNDKLVKYRNGAPWTRRAVLTVLQRAERAKGRKNAPEPLSCDEIDDAYPEEGDGQNNATASP